MAPEEYRADDGWKLVELKPEAALVNGNDHRHPVNRVLDAAATVLSACGAGGKVGAILAPLAGRGVDGRNADGGAYNPGRPEAPGV